MEFNPLTKEYPFLSGGGEMGALTRSFSWSATELGIFETWPQSLRTTVSLLLNSRIPMLLWWGPACVQLYNDAFRDSFLSDSRHPSALGQRGDFCWPENWSALRNLISQARSEGGTLYQDEPARPLFRPQRAENDRWTYSLSPVHDETDGIGGVLVVCQKAMAGPESQQALRQSEDRFRSLIEEAPVATCLFVGRDWVIEIASQSMLTVWGRGADVLGKPVAEVFPERMYQSLRPVLDRVWATGETYHARATEVQLMGDGQPQTCYFDFTYKALLDAEGAVYAILNIAVDVTDLVHSHRQIESNEAMMRSIIASAPAAIGLFVGRDLVVQLPNQSFIEIVGKGPNIVGKPLREVMPELLTENQPFLNILADVYTSGKTFKSYGAQVKIVRNGELTDNYYNITYSPLLNPQGEVYAILDIAIDVTEQIVAHQKIEESESNLRQLSEELEIRVDQRTQALQEAKDSLQSIMDSAPIAIMFFSPVRESGRIVDFCWVNLNKAAEQFHGRPAAELIGHRLLDVFPESGSLGLFDRYVEVVETGVPFQIEQEHETDGVKRWVFISAVRREDGLTLTALDISTRKRAELQLEASLADLQRSNANLEQFAYVASHDLQEPLRKIQQFGDVLTSQYAGQLGNGADLLERMQSASGRMSVLIRDLLAFSRISTRQEISAPVALDDIIRTVLNDLEVAIEESRAVIELEALPTVLGDASQLRQLFQNLLSNALKFRRPEVPVKVKVHCQIVPYRKLPAGVKPTRETAQYYQIDIIDNGIGFDEKYLDRIFQVFQRLHGKTAFAGTGIGLAICEKVAANHGGAITARSQPGEGATFSIFLSDPRAG